MAAELMPEASAGLEEGGRRPEISKQDSPQLDEQWLEEEPEEDSSTDEGSKEPEP